MGVNLVHLVQDEIVDLPHQRESTVVQGKFSAELSTVDRVISGSCTTVDEHASDLSPVVEPAMSRERDVIGPVGVVPVPLPEDHVLIDVPVSVVVIQEGVVQSDLPFIAEYGGP